MARLHDRMIGAHERKGEIMTLDAEVEALDRIGFLPLALCWQSHLIRAAGRLRPWVPSAEMFWLWISDYPKVRQLFNELHSRIERLSDILKCDPMSEGIDECDHALAVDEAVERINELAEGIALEFYRSALDGPGPARE